MFLLSTALLSTLIVFSISVLYFVNRTENIAWRGRQSEAARNAAGTVSGFLQRVRDAMLVVSVVEPRHMASDADELNALLQENTALLEIVRMDSTGHIFVNASRDKSVLANLITIPQSQWFLQARQGQTFIGDVQLSANNEPYLIMAIPSPDNGVVAARVKMDMLWEVVQNILFGKLGRVIVITRTGDIVAHTNSEFVILRRTLIGRPEISAMLNAPNNEWVGSYTNLDHEQVVAATAPVPNTDWIVITELPRSEAYAASRIAVFVLGIEAFLLMLVASLALVGYVRRLIANPMEQLRDGADRIGQGDLNHRINLIRKDEIGQLAVAFDSMAISLQQQQAQVEAQTTALQANEASLRRIADNMFDVITQIGADGTILYASPSHKWVLGVDPAEVLGNMIFEGLHPDDMAEALTLFSQAVAEGTRPKSFALRYRHANGEYLWMECVSAILRDDQGEFSGAILSSRDISDRKKMEADLSASEQRYRLLAENASDVIWSADMNLQMNYISPSVQKLLGYSVEEVHARSILEGMTPESAEYALSFFSQIMAEVETGPVEPLNGASRALELEWIRKDGSKVWTEAKVSFILDEREKPIGLLGVTRDITERKQAEDSRQKAIAYEYESQRARELDILLKASEATSSSLDLDTVLLTLASQLLELSGFESCYISEWDREENLIYGRVEHSRILWVEEKRDAYSLNDYPQTKQVLLTGKPVILQGDFESEERQWMEQLGRVAVMILPLYTEEEIIGLVEIAMSGDRKLFTTKSLQKCEEVIINAAPSVVEPLSANDVKNLFALEEKLLLISGGDICSISEWDKPRNRVVTYAVAVDQILAMGQSRGVNPEKDVAWKQALQEGKTSVWVHSEGNERIEVTGNGIVTMEVEALILFPLQKGEERIGLIELYDFNHKTQVSPEQLALLRAIADKAGFWIENARLLQQTQKRLEEQTELLHEKEVLLKEIHHRVKNNLQVISSLLNLQSSRVTDFQTIQALRDSRSRVRSMSLIHEKLYQSQSLAKIDFGEYVKSLASDLFRSYRQSFTGIQLNVQTDEVLLELDQAVPCGLILNELITNALKYAFPDGRNGTIMVELRASSEHNINLRVADDGVGISPDFDILKTKSLGLQLVNSLVAQLDGRLEMRNLQGTDFLISFPC